MTGLLLLCLQYINNRQVFSKSAANVRLLFAVRILHVSYDCIQTGFCIGVWCIEGVEAHDIIGRVVYAQIPKHTYVVACFDISAICDNILSMFD